MKKMIFSLLLGWVACFAQLPIQAQEFKEHISKEFSSPTAHQVLSVYNVSGSVKIIGYPGTKILMEIDKTIIGKTQQELEIGKTEFKLGFEQTGDTVEAYIAEPNDSRPRHNWNEYDHTRGIKYQYTVNFTIKVPFNINLEVSTVNNGEIGITDVSGSLKVSNVNGSIVIEGAKGITDAHTVNGNVSVNYLTVPSEESAYNTVNGDLRVAYPSALSADIEFKSLNGNFYTDFDNVETLPFKAMKTSDKNEGGTIYKLDKNNNFRFGKGGMIFKFETLNGNVYIKKQS